jgi:hypothetical protein
VPDRTGGQRAIQRGTQPPQPVTVLPVHGDQRGQPVEMNGQPEVVGDFTGRTDLGQSVVPPADQEAHPGDRQVMEAEKEGTQAAFRLAQVDSVRLLRLGVPVQIEQAVGADQVRVELAVADRAGLLQRRHGLAGDVQRPVKRPCQRQAPATACSP